MKSYKDVIASINEDINQYKSLSTDQGTQLNEILKQISAKLYYLETVRSQYHAKWQLRVKELIDNDSSVSRAENLAHVDFPELYELRRTLEGAYGVVNAIRSHLSYLKMEMGNIQ